MRQYHPLPEVALYGAAANLASTFSGLTAQLVVGAVLYPELAAAARGRRERFPDIVRRYFGQLVIYGTAAAFFLSTWGGWFLTLFFGPDYGESVLPLRWLAPSVLLSFVNNYLIFVFFAVGRERVMLLIHFLPVLLSLVSGVLLIPAWGPAGAAVTLLICRGALSVVILVLARHTFSLPGLQELKGFLVPALPAAAVFVALCRLGLHIASLSALIAYGVVARASRGSRPGPT
jgi:O-antigen/teichoic acid export membrane protein